MPRFKQLDFKLVFELMKNSRRSDRELSKILGVSQPTISRRRAILEKELIEGYSAIPKWDELGYKILAIILVKTPLRFSSEQKRNEAMEKATKWLSKQPNVIMAGTCRGMGMTGFMVSVHKSYSDFDDFMNEHRLQLGDLLEDVQSILINLSGEGLYRPLHLKYLAETKL